jgi:hypothetical protein
VTVLPWRAQSLLACLSLVAGAVAAGPGEAVRAAAADAAKQSPKDAPYRRYLILPDDREYREKVFAKVLAFHCNSLSREPELAAPQPVAENVVRVDFRDYGWKRETWEKLAEVEPYLHVDLEKAAVRVEKVAVEDMVWIVPVGGRGYWEKRVRYEERAVKDAPKKDRAHAPWMPTAEIAYLAKTLDSDAPIVRADWFIHQTAVAEGRKAGYYDWLALGKHEADFQRLVGADVKLAAERKKEMAAAVAKSAVTRNNRGIEWFQGFGGGYYRTQDFLSNTQRQNVTRVLKGDLEPPHGDASEQYGFLPNELFGYWLQNKDGVRQNLAPSNIATDTQSTSLFRDVEPMLGCVRCHKEGLRPVNDWMRNVYAQGNPGGLAGKDYVDFTRLQRLYLSDLDGQLKRDNAIYIAALKRLNGVGWTPKVNSDSYGEAWRRYADADLTLAGMAEELETTEEKLLEAARAYVKEYAGAAEPAVVGLLAKGIKVRREHFEESYATYRLLLAGELKGVQ